MSETLNPDPISAKPNRKGIASLFTWKWFAIVIMSSMLVTVGFISAIMAYGEILDLKKIHNIKSSSQLLDINGKEICKLGDSQREYLDLKSISKLNQDLIDAFVMVEDVRFFKHGGVDFRSMLRATYVNAKAGGKKVQGGGTITMQVARNVIIEDHNKKWDRKIKEIGTAWNLERKYTKEQILEAYINYIDFGPNLSGVQLASKVYFGKDLAKNKLEPHEVALLAGLPKAPTTFYPFGNATNQSSAKDRRDTVLKVLSTGNGDMKPIYTKEQREVAAAKDLTSGKKGLKYLQQTKEYVAYKNLVHYELKSRYNIDATNLKTNQYRVYTGLDTNIQRKTEDALSMVYSDNIKAGTATIDVKSGLIAAIGGGKNFTNGDLVVGAFEPRPTGSAIKPLTIFGPAVEKGMDEYSPVEDRKISYMQWAPNNWDKKEHGTIPLKEAVKWSYNLSAIWILKNKVGLRTAYDTAEKLGLEFEQADKVRPAAVGIGGHTEGGATALQMARAYSAFINSGKKVHSYAIKKVEVLDGDQKKSLEPNDTPKDVQVFSPSTAYYVTKMLQGVITDGTGKAARLAGGRPLAGKTGSTNDDKEVWMCGYTPQYITTVATFSTRPSGTNLVKGDLSKKIFRQIMDEAHKDKPFENFPRPSGIKEAVPPVTVMAPIVTGSYNELTNSVELNWQKQDVNVRYEIYKNSVKLADLPGGTVSYVDGDLGDPSRLIGGRTISLHYEIVAIHQSPEYGVLRKSTNYTINLKSDIQPGNPPGPNTGDGAGQAPPSTPLPPRSRQ